MIFIIGCHKAKIMINRVANNVSLIMRQLVILALLSLLSTAALDSNLLFARDRGKMDPVTQNSEDNIDLPYNGQWGWHKVHIRPLKRFSLGSPLAPSRKIDVCFKCHIKSKFTKCDPHTQLDESGNIINDKCLYCHQEKPDEKTADFTVNPDDITFNRDPEMLCLGCHTKKYYLAHPVNAAHLIKPSAEMLSMMKKTQELYGIVLPLNYFGEIMCATCHNPHEKGVIPGEREAAGGAGEEDRIRLPGQAEGSASAGGKEQYMTRVMSFKSRICMACHKDKKELWPE